MSDARNPSLREGCQYLLSDLPEELKFAEGQLARLESMGATARLNHEPCCVVDLLGCPIHDKHLKLPYFVNGESLIPLKGTWLRLQAFEGILPEQVSLIGKFVQAYVDESFRVVGDFIIFKLDGVDVKWPLFGVVDAVASQSDVVLIPRRLTEHPWITDEHRELQGLFSRVQSVRVNASSPGAHCIIEDSGLKWPRWALIPFETLARGISEGSTVQLGEHDFHQNWAPEMSAFVGRTAIIKGGFHLDIQGELTCHVDIDHGSYAWRIKNMKKLALPKDAATPKDAMFAESYVIDSSTVCISASDKRGWVTVVVTTAVPKRTFCVPMEAETVRGNFKCALKSLELAKCIPAQTQLDVKPAK